MKNEGSTMRHRSVLVIGFLTLLAWQSATLAQSVTLRGTVNLTPCAAVDAAGSVVYSATVGSFKVISAAAPTAPTVIGQVAMATGALLSIDVQGTTAYCAAGANGLVIVDVSDGAHPAVTTVFGLSASASCVAVHDTLLAVATPGSVMLYGVRDAAHPHLLTSYGHVSSWVRFDASGTRLHVGSVTGAFDLSIVLVGSSYSLVNHHQYGSGTVSPLAPAGSFLDVVSGSSLVSLHSDDYSLAGQYQAGSAIRAVVGAPGFSFIALSGGSVEYLNQSASGVPTFLAAGGVPSAPTGIAFSQVGAESLVVVSHQAGVSVYSYSARPANDPHAYLVPGEIAVEASPNPFNSTTELNISVPRPGRYDLILYNALGREVQRESLRLDGTAIHTMNFARYGSGLYFVQVSGAAGAVTTRLIYLP
jgi:hypothetical protein